MRKKNHSSTQFGHKDSLTLGEMARSSSAQKVAVENYSTQQMVHKGLPRNVSGMITSFKGINDSPMVTNAKQQPINFSKSFKKVQFQQPTMEQLENNRRLNSQRQVIIKKNKEPQRRRHRNHNNPLLKGGGSLFSQTLGSKSILSAPTAPIGGSINLKSKPQDAAQNGQSSLKQMLRSKTNGFFKRMDEANPTLVGQHKAQPKEASLSRTLNQSLKSQQPQPASTAMGKKAQSHKTLLPLK